MRTGPRGRAVVLSVLLLILPAAFGDAAIPALQAHVTDTTGTLSGSDREALETRLVEFERRKGSQVAVLIVPTTRPETLEQYGIRVAAAWKLGRKGVDDGAMLIVAKDDHRLRIEVGYGLEGALSDATASRIISETITPEFKHGNFSTGIDLGVGRMMAVIDGEALPTPRAAGKHGRSGYEWEWPATAKDIAILVGVLLITAVTVLSTSAGLSVATGSFISAILCALPVGFFIWLFLTEQIVLCGVAGVLTFAACFAMNRYLGQFERVPVVPERRFGGRGRTSRRRETSSSGWSSSSDDSDSRSSSSSDSSYSGGGGGFGGGGASGSW